MQVQSSSGSPDVLQTTLQGPDTSQPCSRIQNFFPPSLVISRQIRDLKSRGRGSFRAARADALDPWQSCIAKCPHGASARLEVTTCPLHRMFLLLILQLGSKMSNILPIDR